MGTPMECIYKEVGERGPCFLFRFIIDTRVCGSENDVVERDCITEGEEQKGNNAAIHWLRFYCNKHARPRTSMFLCMQRFFLTQQEW